MNDGAKRDELLEWVEQLATFLARDGVSPIAARCLGWLMVCDPPEQSAQQIGEAINASRGSMTTNLRLLTAMGFTSHRTRPGDRTTYYRVDDHAWDTVVRRQIASLAAFRELAQTGLDLLGPETRRAQRVKEAHDTFAWMTEVFNNAPPRRRDS